MHINALAKKVHQIKMDKLLAYSYNYSSFYCEQILNVWMCWARTWSSVCKWAKKWTGKKCFQLYTKNFPSTKSRNKFENFCRKSMLQNYHEFGHGKDMVFTFHFTPSTAKEQLVLHTTHYKPFQCGNCNSQTNFINSYSTKIIRILIQSCEKRSEPQQIWAKNVCGSGKWNNEMEKYWMSRIQSQRKKDRQHGE